MNFSNMSNQQLREQISLYESKIKTWKEKIRAELKIRQKLKEKLNEAKKREATQILILERLDEYEEIATKQLEFAVKMEDSESVKQLAVITKYESMLQEQKQIWSVYEKEYEELPLAKQRRKAEIQLMKMKIQNNLILYKLKEIDKMNKMKKKINKRQEQLKIIELAKLYVDQKKKENYCLELLEKIKRHRIEEQNLKQQIKDAERQNEEKKKLKSVVNKSIKSQKLPNIDLSRYIIPRNNYNYDTVSMNSYIFEQEYMNVDDSLSQQSQSVKQTFNANSRETNFEKKSIKINDSQPMDLDNEEKMDDKKEENDSKMDVDEAQVACNNENSSTQSSLVIVECNTEFNKRKSSSQENQSEVQKIENRSTTQKRSSQQQSSQEEIPSKGFVKVSEQRNNYSSPYRSHDRPIPSPAKLQRQVMTNSPKKKSEYQQEQSFVRSHINKAIMKTEFTRHQPTNQSSFNSNDSIDHLTKQFQRINSSKQVMKVEQTPKSIQGEATQKTSIPLSAQKSSCQSLKPQQNYIFMDKQQHQQQPQQQQQQEGTSTSILNIINPSIAPASILNTTMGSSELNMFADNISAILGSDITEPGGSVELARRLHEDSDMLSEASDSYYQKMMENCLSPILSPKQPKCNQEQQEQSKNKISQTSENKSNNIDNSDAFVTKSLEKNEMNFMLTGFVKKPSKKFF